MGKIKILLTALILPALLFLWFFPLNLASGGNIFQDLYDDVIKKPTRPLRDIGKDIDRRRRGAMAHAAAPALANWIRVSRNNAVSAGTDPIPDEIYDHLRNYFPSDVLNAVRYRVGQGHFLNLANSSFNLADQDAITLEEIIVFRDHSSNGGASDHILWAHELGHVMQYRQWGLNGFARRYLDSWSYVENDAKIYENKWRGYAIRITNHCYKKIHLAIRIKEFGESEQWGNSCMVSPGIWRS